MENGGADGKPGEWSAATAWGKIPDHAARQQFQYHLVEHVVPAVKQYMTVSPDAAGDVQFAQFRARLRAMILHYLEEQMKADDGTNGRRS